MIKSVAVHQRAGKDAGRRNPHAPHPGYRSAAPAGTGPSKFLALQRHAGNRAVVRVLARESLVTGGDSGSGVAETSVQRRFDQTVARNQESHHGGVKSQYDSVTNVIELHIDAGANRQNTLMQDFLLALWEARDTITAGQARAVPVPGHLFMRPGGAKVLKMTMELLGEALGAGPHLASARTAQTLRQDNAVPLGHGIAADRREDVLDSTLVPEHREYRDSLVGVAGLSMSPSGGGTSGGMVDMLDTGANALIATQERALYDTATATLRPFMSIAVRVALPQLNTIIAMLEGRAKKWDLIVMRAKYAFSG